VLKANLLLLLAAAIWGFGFVAQRLGMEHLEPYAFNGIRFAIGALSLLPLVWWYSKRQLLKGQDIKTLCQAGLPVGVLLFIGASLQQVGLLYTTASKAGFITGLYIVLVPVLGIFLRHKTSLNIWVGCAVALLGLYFLSVTDDFSLNPGDSLMLIGAFFWAAHLLAIDFYLKKITAVLLAMVQFVICAVLSLLVSLVLENPTLAQALAAWQSLFYAGVISVGLAYTLQIVGQKQAHPAHAAIILSLETVFAALGGVWLLSEVLDQRALFGCGLMLFGMLISQLQLRWLWKTWQEGSVKRLK
jgi:drug/metabolite transporter (DMT)-like permease